MSNIYYHPPPDEIFEELKAICIAHWKKYDDKFGYASGKISRIKDIPNVEDNFMYMFAMFDQINQHKIVQEVSEGLKYALRARLIAGGAKEWYMIAIGL